MNEPNKNSVSLCITCCNRLWQLRQTLPVNLSLYENYDNVEFILLNLNSQDGLDDYIRNDEYINKFIKSGKLIYAHDERTKYYSSPKAKNLSHRLAKNNILFNLDGDQYADKLVDYILNYAWEDDMFMHLQNKPIQPGSWGRIVVPKTLFYKMGGYDESFYPMAYQDCDIMHRMVAYGAKKHIAKVEQDHVSIPNSLEQKTVNTGCDIEWEKMREFNVKTSKENIKNGNLVVNLKGWGECHLKINFGDEVYFSPIYPNII
jgi:predicted glycosyltransferase involved in capsule biosynthesis